jgi:D-sedoheptulose 7-phosphate isomerase
VNFTEDFLLQSSEIIKSIDINSIDKVVNEILLIRSNFGRIFFCGVGGSAGHASHAVNDFRKLARIESYSPTDNISEVTARTNDEGWETVFEEFLRVSRFSEKDAVFVLSVGGGCVEPPVSVNLIKAINYAKSKKGKVLGIVGRDGGYTKKHGDAVVVIPNLFPKLVTPQTEGIAAIIWHLIVSHPKLSANKTKW